MTKHSISGMFNSAVRTVTHSTNAVGNLASACDALSQNAEMNAYLATASSALEMCTEMGLKPAEGELDAMSALAISKNLIQSLRGY